MCWCYFCCYLWLDLLLHNVRFFGVFCMALFAQFFLLVISAWLFFFFFIRSHSCIYLPWQSRRWLEFYKIPIFYGETQRLNMRDDISTQHTFNHSTYSIYVFHMPEYSRFHLIGHIIKFTLAFNALHDCLTVSPLQICFARSKKEKKTANSQQPTDRSVLIISSNVKKMVKSFVVFILLHPTFLMKYILLNAES